MAEKIVVDGTEYTMVGSLKRGRDVLEEHFFAADKSGVLVILDYTYTTKGHK